MKNYDSHADVVWNMGQPWITKSYGPCHENKLLLFTFLHPQVGNFEVAGWQFPGQVQSQTLNFTVPVGTLWDEKVRTVSTTGHLSQQKVVPHHFGLFVVKFVEL